MPSIIQEVLILVIMRNSNDNNFIPYKHQDRNEEEMLNRSAEFYEFMNARRSIRHFSDKAVPKEVIDNILMAASSAPSGANKQPWTFCVVSSKQIKKEVRMLAEVEEKESYSNRMSEEWLEDLIPLGTDWHKDFIETVPWVIVVMKRVYERGEENAKQKNYYVNESVGIACGILIAAIHNAGLCTLTHTPSPMDFLTKALGRPENERAFLLLPIGYPSKGAKVPNIHRKGLTDVAVYYE